VARALSCPARRPPVFRVFVVGSPAEPLTTCDRGEADAEFNRLVAEHPGRRVRMRSTGTGGV
jgi:hypothetical protein